MRSFALRAVILAAFAVCLGVAVFPEFHAPAPPEDEGIPLVYPEMFMKGHYPYRDFETIYGPGNLLVLTGAYSAFGLNIFVERGVGFVYRLAILLSLLILASRRTIIGALGVGVIATILLTSELFANTWMAGLAFALLGLAIVDPESRWRSFVGGFLAALAMLCRCDLGPAIVLAFLPSILFVNSKFRIRFLIGAAIGLLPLAWFAIAVGVPQLVHSLFLFPVFHLSGAAYFPISAAGPALRALFYFHVAASAVNVVAAVMLLKKDKGADARTFLGVALFGAAAIYYALSRFDGSHALNASLVSLALLPVSLSIIGAAIPKVSPTVVRAGATIVALVLLQLIAPWSTQQFGQHLRRQIRQGTFVENDGRRFPLGNPDLAAATSGMLQELSRMAAPGQRLLVGPGDFRRTVGTDTFLYHLLPRLQPATYYLEMNPGSTNAPGSRIATDIASADWLILDRRWDLINEPNKSSEYGSDEGNEVVREKFDFLAEFGPYLLMRNRRLRNFLQAPAGQSQP